MVGNFLAFIYYGKNFSDKMGWEFMCEITTSWLIANKVACVRNSTVFLCFFSFLSVSYYFKLCE
jgi:hypothetical protein